MRLRLAPLTPLLAAVGVAASAGPAAAQAPCGGLLQPACPPSAPSAEPEPEPAPAPPSPSPPPAAAPPQGAIPADAHQRIEASFVAVRVAPPAAAPVA